MSFKALCKAFIGRHEIAYDEEDHVLEQIGPGMVSLKEVPEADPDKGKRDQELEYASPTIGPFSQPFD